MKNLIILRHGHSEMTLQSDDKLRELSALGKMQSIAIADFVGALSIPIDLIVCSSAKRTLQTCEPILEKLPKANFNIVHEMYNAPVQSISSIISNLPNVAKNVLYIGHNNGITHWINDQNAGMVDYLLPCSIVGMQLNCNAWTDYYGAAKKIIFEHQVPQGF
jgi:phosphohistidine phosphatase SixA